MMQYVDMGAVNIVEGQALELPPERPNSSVLTREFSWPLGRGAYQDAVIGMPLAKRTDDGVLPNTDWPIKRSFPVFLLNALEYLGGAVSTAGSKTIKPGEPVTLSLATRFKR